MFGWRADGVEVPKLHPMRRFMPYISPRRNDSVFYLQQMVDVEDAVTYCEKLNKDRPDDRPVTVFHLFLRAWSQALVTRPGINRFVKAGRLYQHKQQSLSFALKTEIRDGAPLKTIKREFDAQHETLEEMVDAVYAVLKPAKAGKESTADKEVSLLLLLPSFVIGWLLRGLAVVDHLGLMPRGMIDSDPLFSSGFAANLGSVKLGGGFHHLWEYGTCSIFGVMGEIVPGPDGRRQMTLSWTYDERIEDGLYSGNTIHDLKDRIENPQRLEESVVPPE